MNKKTVILMGVGFVVSLVLTIVFRIFMDNQNLEYEEVQVRVVSADAGTTRVKTRYSSNTITNYNVKAYLSNGKLYANVEGVNTSTPVAYVYFGFMIASFLLLMVFLCNTPHLFKNKWLHSKNGTV